MFQLTRFSHNTVFFRNQNARYAGTRCTKVALKKFLSASSSVFGTIHLRRQKIFTIFYPYPHNGGSFLTQSISKFGKICDPSPLKNAQFLNERSLWAFVWLITNSKDKRDHPFKTLTCLRGEGCPQQDFVIPVHTSCIGF